MLINTTQESHHWYAPGTNETGGSGAIGSNGGTIGMAGGTDGTDASSRGRTLLANTQTHTHTHTHTNTHRKIVAQRLASI